MFEMKNRRKEESGGINFKVGGIIIMTYARQSRCRGSTAAYSPSLTACIKKTKASKTDFSLNILYRT